MTSESRSNSNGDAAVVDSAIIISQQQQQQSQQYDYSALIPARQLERMIEEWILDDIPTFDVGAFVVANSSNNTNKGNGKAYLFMKSPGVFAGKPFFDTVFRILHCTIEWNTEYAVEGKYLDPTLTQPNQKIHLATVFGPIQYILQGERTALNIISRCSGVATISAKAVRIAQEHDWKGWIAGTRKTTPGSFRLIEKYGLMIGGATTHRHDLSQMTMLKDNHIMAAGGSITTAVQCARRGVGFSSKIEVECQNKQEAIEAANAGADIVMLDNFTSQQLKVDAVSIKEQFPHVLIEASGGITLNTISEYFCDAVDIISQGHLTQGYPCIDFSLKIV